MSVRFRTIPRLAVGALVFAGAASAVSPVSAQTGPSVAPTEPPIALIQTSPLGAELNSTVDLCDDDGAAAWGLDEANLAVERARLGIDCSRGAVIGRIDLFGESTIGVDEVAIPAPPSAPEPAPSRAGTTSLAAPVAEDFTTALLGFYSTAAPGDLRPHPSTAGSVTVLSGSLTHDGATVRGLVHNASARLARNVTVRAGGSEAAIPIALQPGETAGFAIDGVSSGLGADLADAITLDAELSGPADFGRSIALSETYRSSPDAPELLVTTARPDNVAVPPELAEGFVIVDANAIVASLDEQGRVLDVVTVSVLGDLGATETTGPGRAGEIAETNRIDPALGIQLVRAATPDAASVVINVGGTAVAGSVSARARAGVKGAAEAAFDSLEVTRGTFRGVMAGVNRLFAQGRGCAAVSTSRLASVLFAIPAHELAGWQPPAPASFGRSDNLAVDSANERLYSFGRDNGNAARAFWAAGVGLYQIDTLNLRVGAFAKTNTKRATMLVGGLLLDRWCDAGEATMRAFLSNTWFACANDVCFDTANQLYDESRDSLRNMAQSGGNSVTGGVKNRFCWSSDRPGVYVRCRYFDISRLQGEMNMIAPDGGAGTNPYTPLPADFVELTIPTADGPAEARVFMSGNTGYAREIWAIRPLGTNPRTSLRWFSAASPRFDKDLSVWSCSKLNDTNPGCSWSTTTAR